jgi:hypothetical protein
MRSLASVVRGLTGSGFRNRHDWMLQGSMPMKFERNMRLALAAPEHLSIESIFHCSVSGIPI